MSEIAGLREPPSFLRRHRALILIVVVGLALRIALFVAVRPWEPEVAGNTVLVLDALGYHTRAVSILETGTFEAFRGFRTPLYPLFIAGVYSLFGQQVHLALLAQAIIGAITVILAYAWAKVAVGQKAALLAAGVVALEPLTVFYSVTLLAEVFFTFVLLSALVALAKGLEARNLSLVIVGGLVMGAAALVKPVAQYLPVIAVVFVLFHVRLTQAFRAKAAILFVCTFFIALAPWLYRNYSEYGHAKLSTIQGENLLFYTATYLEVTKTGKPVGRIRSEFWEQASERGASEDGNPFENERVFREVALEYLSSDPAFYAKRHLKGVVNMFLYLSTQTMAKYLRLPATNLQFRYYAAPGFSQMLRSFIGSKSRSELTLAVIVALASAVTYLSAIVGGVALLRERKYLYLFFTLAVILYFCASVGLIGESRYKLPLIPLYGALSGKGLYETFRFLRRRVWRRRRHPGFVDISPTLR